MELARRERKRAAVKDDGEEALHPVDRNQQTLFSRPRGNKNLEVSINSSNNLIIHFGRESR